MIRATTSQRLRRPDQLAHRELARLTTNTFNRSQSWYRLGVAERRDRHARASVVAWM